MRIRPALLLTVAVAVTALGCPAEAPSTATKPFVMPTVPAGDYFPLVEGSAWKYSVVTQGALIQGTATYTVTKVTKAGSETRAEGMRQLNLTYSGQDRYEATAPVSWRKAKDGVYETVEGEEGERRVLALPLKYAATWNYGTISMQLSDVQEVEINAKTYKGALRVRAYDGDKPGAAYFVKDVGLVSWSGRTLAVGCGLQIGLGLLEHTKKGAPVPTSAPSATPPSCGPLPQAGTGARTPTPFPFQVIDVSPSPGATPSANTTASPSPTPSESHSATPSAVAS